MDQEELKKLSTSILGLVIPDFGKKDQITELFESGSLKNNLKKNLQNKKEDEFYAHNNKNKKSVRDLQLYKKISLEIV